MKQIDFVKEYFENETKGLTVEKIELVERKASYLFSTNCYEIITKEKANFYVFCSDNLPTNLYLKRDGETLNECYYKHIGFMLELTSECVSSNFILEFVNNNSIFPIIERKINQIEKEIQLSKNATQLKGIANQIRDCYLDLTDYLMNKSRTENEDYKHDNFKANYQEFLNRIIPGCQSETRRNAINGIANKGWMLNSELVHKDSITVFDVCISLNILKLIISTTSNLMTGKHMPFNTIKCPNCQSENYSMRQDDNRKEYIYVCKDCKTRFTQNLEEILNEG